MTPTLTLSLPLLSPSSPSKPPLWLPTPQLLSLHPTLRHLLSASSLSHLQQIHALAITSGSLHDNFATSRLLGFAALSPVASLPYALHIFNTTPNPDPFMANILIRAYASSPQPLHALEFYIQISQSFILRHPDKHSFPLLLKACSDAKSLEHGRMLHAQVAKFGLGLDVGAQNALVQMYASCGVIDFVRAVFDGILEFDDAYWNVMLGGLMKCGQFEEAREVFDGMDEMMLFLGV